MNLTKVIAGGKYVVMDGGATWPTPMDDPDGGLEWRLRYSDEKEVVKARYLMASIVSAYRELIEMPESRRRIVIRELRRAVGKSGDSR